MSSLDKARATTQNSRRTTAAAGARPRASSRTENGEYSDSAGELFPQDSVSNAPHKKTTSTSQRSSRLKKDLYEKRTEKTRTTITASVQTRIKSPTKPTVGHGTNGNTMASGERSLPREKRVDSREQNHQKKGKEALPPWKPQASLIDHTTAPLAARITTPPSSSLLPDVLQPLPLKKSSIDLQEVAILEDLLFAFMGYEGRYIRFDESYDPSAEKGRLGGPKFTLLSGLDPSLRDLATTMLKMATHYCAIDAFVEVQSREEFGMINHALCASIRKQLKEYLSTIAQLEYQLLNNVSFTLHVLHIQILPMMNVMYQLYTLAQEISRQSLSLEEQATDIDDYDDENILEQLKEGGELIPGAMSKKTFKGGNVLRLLTERLSYMSGDPAVRDLLLGLLRDASRPYMSMLNEWLHHGGIKDPHSEFLIKEQKAIKPDKLKEDYTNNYWDNRYTIRENDVPPQLEAVKEKVLLAGKYLNVVRECGGVDVSTEVKDVPKTFDDPAFLDNVNAAYAHANSSLLNLLLTTHALPARLRSMKHYFFLDRSDFFSYFLFLSDSELKKPAKSVNVNKLQSLLDLVLRQPGSVAALDPFKEDVKVHMSEHYLTKFLMRVVNVQGLKPDEADESTAQYQMTTNQPTEEDGKMNGFEALEFKYSVPFPLSLVISSNAVVRYQILFRFLLSMRHLEGLIINSWEDHNKLVIWTHKSSNRQLEVWKRRARALRARMLSFVQHFTYYCTSEVIEPRWQILMAKVNGNDDSAQDTKSGTRRLDRTVDELMTDHLDFLDTCLKECMLMNSRLLRLHNKLISASTLFATYMATVSRTLCCADVSLAGTAPALAYLSTQYPRHPIPDRLKTFDADALAKMEDMLAKYEGNFEKNLRVLLEALDFFAATENMALGRLCAQLSMVGEKGSQTRERSLEVS